MLRAASSGGSSSSRPGVGHYAALREPESPAEARAPGCGGYPSRRRSHAASGQATRPGRHLAGQGLDLHWLRRHREDLAPPAPGDQPGQCREPQPAGRLAADPAGLAAQHRVLVPEHQELGVPGRLAPGQHHQAAGQTASEQAGHREDHSAMLPAPKTARARPDRVTEPRKVADTQKLTAGVAARSPSAATLPGPARDDHRPDPAGDQSPSGPSAGRPACSPVPESRRPGCADR
jgi:hypothetical protein